MTVLLAAELVGCVLEGFEGALWLPLEKKPN